MSAAATHLQSQMLGFAGFLGFLADEIDALGDKLAVRDPDISKDLKMQAAIARSIGNLARLEGTAR